VRNFGDELFSVKVKMSPRPEDEEPVDEVEEGEIVSEQEDEEEIEFSGDEDEYFPEDDEMNLMTMMSSLLATPDGDTVCSALVNLCYQLETQNKILIKMLSKMQSQK
jgi:hypothetical protein